MSEPTQYQRPLISVVTVCRNSAATIERTLQGVLAQGYINYEYILVDGGSTDGTLDIIRRFEPRFGSRMSWASGPDSGIYDAMNKGIARARGELIGIINSDDWYEPETLTLVAQAYRGNPGCVYYGILRMIRNGQVEQLKCWTEHAIAREMIQHPTWFVPAEFYRRLGAFNTRYRVSADYELFNRFAAAGVRFCRIERVLANFTIGGVSQGLRGPLESLRIQHHNGYIGALRYALAVATVTTRHKLKELLRR